MDDLLIEPNKSQLQRLTDSLNKKVSLNDLGESSYLLCVRIQRLSPTENMRLDQKRYIDLSLVELCLSEKDRLIHQCQWPVDLT